MVDNQLLSAALKWKLHIFQDTFQYATVLIPSLVIAPRYFRDEVPFGAVSQAGMAFGRVFRSLSLMVSKCSSFVAFRTSVQR